MAQNSKNSTAEYLTFLASGGESQTSVEMRYEDENIWLTQKLMAELYSVSVPAINQHLKRLFFDNELERGATIKKYLIVQTEGERQVQREVDHYRLQAIIAVGFKIENERAIQFRKWASQIRSPNGAFYVSLGQRPRNPTTPNKALKGRPKSCLNHSRKTSSTLFSAPKTATPTSARKSEWNFMPTSPPFLKTSIAPPLLSTLWTITSISFSTSIAPSRYQKSLRKLKNHRRNGLNQNLPSLKHLHGKQAMAHFQLANPILKRLEFTFKTNRNTIKSNRFKMKCGRFSPNIESNMMNAISGISALLQGFVYGGGRVPRALPWAGIENTFGVHFAEQRPRKDHPRILSSKGVSYVSLEQRPYQQLGKAILNPKGASYVSLGQRPHQQLGEAILSPKGAFYVSLGQRPRFASPPRQQALKGRHKSEPYNKTQTTNSDFDELTKQLKQDGGGDE